jgi:hypothetical protein
MELITAVFVRASGGLMYIIPGDANIFRGPGTRHALVSAGLRHKYVYLTSNTTALRYTRIHTEMRPREAG